MRVVALTSDDLRRGEKLRSTTIAGRLNARTGSVPPHRTRAGTL